MPIAPVPQELSDVQLARILSDVFPPVQLPAPTQEALADRLRRLVASYALAAKSDRRSHSAAQASGCAALPDPQA